MIEYWDVYNPQRTKTGKQIKRGEKLGSNEYHYIVHIWIKLNNGKYVITKRSSMKDLYPCLWETTGGCVISGETSEEAALREVEEETGIKIMEKNLKYFRTFNSLNCFSNHFVDVFVAKYECDLVNPIIGKSEIEDYRITTKDEIIRLMETGQFVPDARAYIYDLFKYCEEI